MLRRADENAPPRAQAPIAVERRGVEQGGGVEWTQWTWWTWWTQWTVDIVDKVDAVDVGILGVSVGPGAVHPVHFVH